MTTINKKDTIVDVTGVGLVDQLGILKAQIAMLVDEENELKSKLIARGVGEYNGNLFRATIVESERAQLDIAAVRRKLDPKWIKMHTTYVDVVTVRVSARIREELKAA